MKKIINPRNIKEAKFYIFLIFFVLKQKDSTTVHVNEEGFDPKSERKKFHFIKRTMMHVYDA